MSESWRRIRAEAVVMEWTETMRRQGGLSRTGTLAGHQESVALVEQAWSENYSRGIEKAARRIAHE